MEAKKQDLGSKKGRILKVRILWIEDFLKNKKNWKLYVFYVFLKGLQIHKMKRFMKNMKLYQFLRVFFKFVIFTDETGQQQTPTKGAFQA